jgi:hypothetical protein
MEPSNDDPRVQIGKSHRAIRQMGAQPSQPDTKEIQSHSESNNRYCPLCAIEPMALHGLIISHLNVFVKDA